ncbi:hypothetical protein Agabi119p4_9697 [Agaricus bisporus var. burnettii]|uniref:Uncharacterized protein n=1 Tax=Agaricus bisporus var. burnettii TaxID=192524 RepID=A0A8H7C446_AGABI|nr:hypothetical protein Agabi119p4_9697 [Agaricus bisporus var. burnettii]
MNGSRMGGDGGARRWIGSPWWLCRSDMGSGDEIQDRCAKGSSEAVDEKAPSADAKVVEVGTDRSGSDEMAES